MRKVEKYINIKKKKKNYKDFYLKVRVWHDY